MVYLAFAVLALGVAARLASLWRAPGNPITLQIYPEKRPRWLYALHDTFLLPTVRRHKPVLWVFLMIFHIGLLFLILGHLELVAEIPLFQILPHQVFIGHGFVGLILCITVMFLLFRRFRSPLRDLSVPEDYYLLILLFLIFLTGSEMDWARTWYYYDGLTVEHYRQYLWSLVTLRPELPYEALNSGHSFMLVVHVFLANVFLMAMPFTKIMHSFLSLPMNKLRRG